MQITATDLSKRWLTKVTTVSEGHDPSNSDKDEKLRLEILGRVDRFELCKSWVIRPKKLYNLGKGPGILQARNARCRISIPYLRNQRVFRRTDAPETENPRVGGSITRLATKLSLLGVHHRTHRPLGGSKATQRKRDCRPRPGHLPRLDCDVEPCRRTCIVV